MTTATKTRTNKTAAPNQFAGELQKMLTVAKRALDRGFTDVSIAGWRFSEYVKHVETMLPTLRNNKASNQQAITARSLLYMLLNNSFRETLWSDQEGVWLEFEA